MGHSAKYLDPTKVTDYVALEPNKGFHEQIRLNAALAGFSTKQIHVLSQRAEDTAGLASSLGGYGTVDTILCILSLCGIPQSEVVVQRLATDLLKPNGGQLLFYEHVHCEISPATAFFQRFWTPVWEPLVGCKLDKKSDKVIDELPGVIWKERDNWTKEGELPNVWYHRLGAYIKA